MKIWPSGPLIFKLSCISPMKDEFDMALRTSHFRAIIHFSHEGRDSFLYFEKKIKNKNGLELPFIFVLF